MAAMDVEMFDMSVRRKRERSEPDDDQEFMPLSKRITCLNLNPCSEEARMSNVHNVSFRGQGLSGVAGQEVATACQVGSQSPLHCGGQPSSPGGVASVPVNGSVSPVQSALGYTSSPTGRQNFNEMNGAGLGQNPFTGLHGLPDLIQHLPPEAFRYQPSLDEESNPYYYEQNRKHFNLYLERMQRNHMNPHPYLISQAPNYPGGN